MRFYADSARLERVVPLLKTGLVAGVTSNPTIVLRDGHLTSQREALYQAFDTAGANEILMQAVGATAAAMMLDAETLVSFGDRMIVKVPATDVGFRTAAKLSARPVPVRETQSQVISTTRR